MLRDFFTNTGKYYVPPKRDFPLSFCKDILAGKKRLMKLSNVHWVGKVPHWKEFTVKLMWQKA